MKVVILAGGLGSRLQEETEQRPKPMVEIGLKPILWHIMKIYSSFGFNDFILCLGYKAYVIKQYFLNYLAFQSDFTLDLAQKKVDYFETKIEPWKITFVNTGVDTMTGGRLLHIEKYIGKEPFLMTYGDGVANINIKELIKFHKTSKKLATLTAVQPFGRFGSLKIDEDGTINNFEEKPRGDGGWINGGYFVLEPEIFKYIKDGSTVWEQAPMQKLCLQGQLSAYRHKDFWMCMDTIRDRNELERLWSTGKAPWQIWNE